VGHPLQPEYAIGAVTPGDGVFLRDAEDLTEDEVAAALDAAKTKAAVLDRRLHEKRPAAGLEGKSCLLVDDGLATGATMIAAVRFAKSQGARRVVAAVPVAADESLDLIRREADAVVCPNPVDAFWAVSLWYEEFWPVEDEDVLRLLREADARLTARPRP
jgi:putative phosphoribosyl transferase